MTLEDYRAAGGAVEGDLFSEAVYLRDKPLLERLAAEKIAAIKARITEVEGGFGRSIWTTPSIATRCSTSSTACRARRVI